MAANGISTLPTLQERQIAKLEEAQTKRQAGGDSSQPYWRPLNTYDITLLPTQYDGNNIYDNPNPDGLIPGRPWLNGNISIDYKDILLESGEGLLTEAGDNINWE